MIGYDNSHSLCLYSKKDQKVLPKSSFSISYMIFYKINKLILEHYQV
jgi:hypothetical protein